MFQPRYVLLLVAVLVSTGFTSCGRKGALEVPGMAAAPLATDLRPTERLGDTVISGPARAPALRGEVPGEAPFRSADIRGDNADAPETGDAIAEGPTAGAVVPKRRFVLDPLL